jgi:hypothetical protein
LAEIHVESLRGNGEFPPDDFDVLVIKLPLSPISFGSHSQQPNITDISCKFSQTSFLVVPSMKDF